MLSFTNIVNIGDEDNKVTKYVKEFVKNFNGNEILYIFINFNKDYKKYTKFVDKLDEHIKNYICLWSWNNSVKDAIELIDCINTTRYNTSGWLIQTGLEVKEKDEQQKLKKILDES